MNRIVKDLRQGAMREQVPGPAISESGAPADPAQTEIYAALASQAIFWRPRHVTASALLGQMPFLFWTVETLRPRAVAQIGLDDGLVYLGICQALERLGAAAACTALLPPGAVLPEGLRQQHDAQYGDFSTLIHGDIAAPPPHLDEGIDMLVLHQALDPGQVDAVLTGWLPHLSDRGVILICRPDHGPDHVLPALPPQSDSGTDRRGITGLTAPGDRRLDVILHGSNPPERLLRLAQAGQASPLRLFARQIFGRLGKGLEDTLKAGDLQRWQQQASDALHQAEALRERLEEARAQGGELAGWRNRAQALEEALAGRDAEAGDLRQRADRAEVAAAAAIVRAEAQDGLRAELEARIAELETEAVAQRDLVRALRGELSDSQKSRASDRARVEELQREKADLTARIADAGAELATSRDAHASDRTRVEELRREKAALETGIADARRQHEARIEDIAVLTRQAGETREQDRRALADLRKKLARSEASCATLRSDRKALQGRKADLEAKLARCRRDHADRIAEIFDSTSWRVTRPMRGLKDAVTGWRRR